MVKLLVVAGKTVKYGSIVLSAAIIAKLALVVYYGYMNINPEYGGMFYYHWRTKYMDKKLSKSYYSKNRITDQPEDPIFTKYFERVQKTGVKGKEYPYYAYKLPDTFVLGPDATWKLFRKNEKMLDAELEFLKFRGKLICLMYRMYGLDKYNEEAVCFLGKEEGKCPPPIKEEVFRDMSGDKTSIETFFTTPGNDFMGIHKDFTGLIGMIKKTPGHYKVTFKDKKAVVSDDLLRGLQSLLKKALPVFDISDEDISEFFYRLATLKPTALDVHILHRFYWYYFYTMSAEDVRGIGDKHYDSYTELIDKLNATTPKTEEVERKLKNNTIKREQRRSELIFNKFTYIVANILGTKGPISTPDVDKRRWLEKKGSPGVSNETVHAEF